jgi:glycosyltransferase involved in cell wall biosynthesis
MKKVKILYVLPQAQQGGAETQQLILLENLDSKIFEVYLGLLYENNQMLKQFQKIPDVYIKKFNKRSTFDVGVFKRIADFINENKIDIVHTLMGNHHAYIPSLFARRSFPIGGIMSSCDESLPFSSRFMRFFVEKYVSQMTSYQLISCSYSGRKIYLEHGFQRNKVHVIPNGIDYTKFSKGRPGKLRKQYNLSDSIIIGTVGRLTEVKNQSFLIRITKKLVDRGYDMKLVIVGDGDQKKKLQRTAMKFDITDRVIFTGNRTDVPDLLSDMDLFVFSSVSEGWPNAIGEAMSAGLPVVTFNVGDVSYIINNDVNGLIAKNDLDFQKKLEYILRNKQRSMLIGKRAKKTIKENFSIKKMIEEYQNFYLNLGGTK